MREQWLVEAIAARDSSAKRNGVFAWRLFICTPSLPTVHPIDERNTDERLIEVPDRDASEIVAVPYLSKCSTSTLKEN